jgi:hypothetical protein
MAMSRRSMLCGLVRKALPDRFAYHIYLDPGGNVQATGPRVTVHAPQLSSYVREATGLVGLQRVHAPVGDLRRLLATPECADQKQLLEVLGERDDCDMVLIERAKYAR